MKSSGIKVLALFATIALLAGCAGFGHHHDDHDDHAHGHADGAGLGRLLVHTVDGGIFILDASDGDVLAEYRGELDPGPAFVNVNSTGEFGFVTHRDNWLTVVLASGYELEGHGDHYDLHIEDPELLGSLRTGLKPSHYYSASGISLFYNDDSGTISLLDEKELRQSLVPKNIKARVDHGAPLLVGNSLVVGYLNSRDIEILDLDGTVRQTLRGGTRLHGEARFGRFTAFGLAEGVALLTWDGRQFTSRLLPKPASIAGDARINHLRSHILVPHFIGRSNTGNYLAVIDPVSENWLVRQLPASFTQFGFDNSGEFFLVLDSQGVLHVLDPYTLDSVGSLQAATPKDGVPAAALAFGLRHVWVSDPADNSIALVSLEEMEIEARFALPQSGNIGAMALMQSMGVSH